MMRRMTRMIVLWAALILLLGSCSPAGVSGDNPVSDTPIARPRLQDALSYHDGYLYFSADTVLRCSVTTGTLTSLCSDPLCFHDTEECPFFMVGTTPEIHGTRLFYEGVDTENYTYPWYVYDLEDGTRKRILEEAELGSFPTLHRGRLYYRRNILREGEPEGDLASYDQVLFCLDAETLEKRQLCVLGRADETEPDAIVEYFGDRILWQHGSEWYTTDLDGGDRKAFGAFCDIEQRGMLCDREEGVLYGVRMTDELLGYTGSADGPYADRRPVYNRVAVIIRADGSVTELPGLQAAGFAEVTEGYLYYYKLGEITETSMIDGALYRCRHDGSGGECVLTAEELNGAEICRIAGGAAYLREAGALVKLDFETKERTVLFGGDTQ